MFDSVRLMPRPMRKKSVAKEHPVEYARILVPVAGRKTDDEAVGLACELAGQTAKGTIIAVHVISMERSLPLDAEIQNEIERAESILAGIEEKAKRFGCQAETEILQARGIGAAIIGLAKERGVDLILMGLNCKTKFGEFCLGEIAAYVFKNAHCHVLVQQRQELSGT